MNHVFKYLLPAILLLVSFENANAQKKVYFLSTNDGEEAPIIEKLTELGYKITIDKDSADYIFQCLTSKKGMNVYQGQLKIYGDDGNLMISSKPVKSSMAVWNGYTRGSFLSMQRIANRYLESLMQNIENAKR